MSRPFSQAKKGTKSPLTPTDESVLRSCSFYCLCPLNLPNPCLSMTFRLSRLYIEVSFLSSSAWPPFMACQCRRSLTAIYGVSGRNQATSLPHSEKMPRPLSLPYGWVSGVPSDLYIEASLRRGEGGRGLFSPVWLPFRLYAIGLVIIRLSGIGQGKV